MIEPVALFLQLEQTESFSLSTGDGFLLLWAVCFRFGCLVVFVQEQTLVLQRLIYVVMVMFGNALLQKCCYDCCFLVFCKARLENKTKQAQVFVIKAAFLPYGNIMTSRRCLATPIGSVLYVTHIHCKPDTVGSGNTLSSIVLPQS